MPFRRVRVRGVDDFDLQRMISATFKWAEIALVMILILVGAASSVYTVPTDSMGVIKRFGCYHRSTEPGIHVKIPFWIETVVSVPVKKIQKEEQVCGIYLYAWTTCKSGNYMPAIKKTLEKQV